MPRQTGAPRDAGSTTSLEMSWAHGGPGRGERQGGLILLYTPNYGQLPAGYVLRGDDLVIGRDDRADLCVPSRAISRQHARISRRDGRWVLADLGGRNGTIVNGALVGEAAGGSVLEHRDEIHIGDAIFKFVEDNAPGYLRHRIDGTLASDVAPGAKPSGAPPSSGRVIGSYQIQHLVAELGKVAASDLSVLILGESGTGKEVFAQELHERSGRSGPFQAVNCAAIPPTLIEAELFGHRKGAFSGADRDRPGLIRAANGGTLFLDEIGDMPLEAQAKLLRVLQSKEVLPIGASQAERVDVRIVCATHRDLRKLQRDERFRGDLFARLNEYSLRLPALRERKEDLFALCLAFAARYGRPNALVSFPFMTGIIHYDFPYNVRELESLIKRWAAVASGPELGAEHLTEEIKELMKTYGQPRAADAEPPTPATGVAGQLAERGTPGSAAGARQGGPPSEQALRELLAKYQGNIAAVGRELGKERVQVHRWLRRYGINVSEYRPPDD